MDRDCTDLIPIARKQMYQAKHNYDTAARLANGQKTQEVCYYVGCCQIV